MGKYKAIPQGYMTVGEIAKKMGVTVRTLQYYDEKGLFSPSAESEGGRRLYTDKDLIRLYQILSLKHLGFSLEDIKHRIMSLNTPSDVAKVLTEQAAEIKRKIQSLSQACKEIELLKTEVLQMQSVDFKKYADILANIQMKNEFYWLIKHFDETLLNHIQNRFDRESSIEYMQRFTLLGEKILALQNNNVPPDSEAAQSLAKSFWKMLMEFTDGDMSTLSSLMKFTNANRNGNRWEKKQAMINAYIGKALDIYFARTEGGPVMDTSSIITKTQN